MIIAEIGLNHLGSVKILKKYINEINNSKVDAITIQIISKNFFIKNNILKYFIKKKKLYEIIFKFSKKKVGLIIDKVDEDTLKYQKKISFFKILGAQINDKNLISSIKKLNKKIFISNKNLNKKDQDKLNTFCSKNKNIFLIHTQGNKKHHPRYSNLYNIDKLNKATNKKTSFGLHCEDVKITFLALLFKPMCLFFYIKGDTKLKYPDHLHSISLKNLNSFVVEIKRINNFIKFWK